MSHVPHELSEEFPAQQERLRAIAAASNSSSSTSQAHFSAELVTPTTRAPRCRAICPAISPVGLAALPISTVSPATGRATSCIAL